MRKRHPARLGSFTFRVQSMRVRNRNVVCHVDADQLSPEQVLLRRVLHGQSSDSDIGFAFTQIKGATIRRDAEFDSRIRGAEHRELFDHHVGHELIAAGQLDRSGKALVLTRQIKFQCRHLALDPFGAPHHSLPCFGQRVSITTPIEEPGRKLDLQRFDTPGDSRVAYAERRTCSANRPGARQREKVADVIPVHARSIVDPNSSRQPCCGDSLTLDSRHAHLRTFGTQQSLGIMHIARLSPAHQHSCGRHRRTSMPGCAMHIDNTLMRNELVHERPQRFVTRRHSIERG